ncbi:MAG TPA: hypothetical protein VMV10_06350 [Pirellulales bacterium]|nr:hypothetical protein [Pirellulales bacterium]
MSAAPPTNLQFTLRRLLIVIGAIGLAIGALVGGWRLYFHWLYPYGRSHCCDTGLWASLQSYAASHGGAFPAGEATPEASMSLLYPKHADANALRGKIVPLAEVEAALKKNGRLDPTTCGWHYVEGLTTSDDGTIAVLWDKVGLGHNGERLPQGDHDVLFLSGHTERISGDQWQAFLEEQKKLFESRPTQPGQSTASAPETR